MVKFSFVFMGGKGKYRTKSVVTKIKQNIKKFSLNDNGKKKTQNKSDAGSCSTVIYCFDCDGYNKNAEDHRFLKEVQQYCKEMNYDYVWFCRDVEEVYLGERIPDHLKKEKAALFKSKKQIQHIDKRRLEAEDYNVGRSNLMKVLDMYLTQK